MKTYYRHLEKRYGFKFLDFARILTLEKTVTFPDFSGENERQEKSITKDFLLLNYVSQLLEN